MFVLIRDIILATDLAHHLKILHDIKKMAEGELTALMYPCGCRSIQALLLGLKAIEILGVKNALGDWGDGH